MAQIPTSVCITCGLATGEVAQLNRLPNGQICPTCRERVLDSIPAALPASVSKSSLDLRLEAESNREVEYDGEVRPWPPHGYGTR
jgi:hypothetical protein